MEELRIGTQLRATEHGVLLYEITRTRTQPGHETLYEITCIAGQELLVTNPVWCTAEVVQKHFPYVVPSADVPAGVPAGAPDVGDSRSAGGMAESSLSELRDTISLTIRTIHDALRHPTLASSAAALEAVVVDLREAYDKVDHGAFDEQPPPLAPKHPLRDWDGQHCPYCGVDMNEWGEYSSIEGPQDRIVWQNVRCGNCQEEWAETYVLTDASSGDDCLTPLAFTVKGSVLDRVEEIRGRLADLHQLLEREGERGFCWKIEDILSLLPEQAS